MSSYLYFLLYQDYGRVIGVSKRCCPTCHSLLSLLANDRERPFLVKGSHSTVTACTLPPWLPSDVVDDMNQIFGGHLGRELVKIYESPSTRSRSLSTGSQRLSSDIGHEVGGTSITPMISDKARGRLGDVFNAMVISGRQKTTDS